jgi:hypothetical protein
MKRSLIHHENKSLTYDDSYSKLKEEYKINIQNDEKQGLEEETNKKQYTRKEIENILKECIENMLIEIKNILEEKFEKYDFKAVYNKYVNNWNEVLFSIEVNRRVICVKLSNDYICDNINNISSVYITLNSDGKGVFTECIERVNQHYEFIGSAYAYAPASEIEICFREVDKDKFVKGIICEINKII